MNNIIILNKNDNVAVATFPITPKTKIVDQGIVSIDPIPFGHKICLKSINKGEPVIKYDQVIGFASQLIKAGEHVHSHNLEFKEFSRSFSISEKKILALKKVIYFLKAFFVTTVKLQQEIILELLVRLIAQQRLAKLSLKK